MDNQKIYLLAEITVLLEFLDDVKAAFKQALVPTLQEPGCEARSRPHGRATRISWSSLRFSPLWRHMNFTLNRTTRRRCLQH